MSGLLRDSSWLGVALAAQLVFSLVAQRILNRHLMPEERGMIAFSMLSIGVFYDALRLGAGRGVTYLVAAGGRAWAVVNVDLLWGCGVSVVCLIAVALLPLSEGITGTAITVNVAFLAWFSQAARIPSTFAAALSGLGRYRAVGLSAAAASLVLLASRALLVPSYGVVGEFVAYSLSVLLTSVPCMIIMLRDYPIVRPTRGETAQLWDYARRSAGIQAGTIIAERGLPLVLFPFLGPAAAGVYAAAAVVPAMLGAGVSLITRPLFSRSSTMAPLQVEQVFAPACRLLTAASTLGALVLAMTAPLAVKVLGAEHYPHAASAMIILALQIPLRTLSLAIGAHLSGSGHPEVESRSLLFSAGVMLGAAAAGAYFGGLHGALFGEFAGVALRLTVVSRGLKSIRGLTFFDVAVLRRADVALVLNRLKFR